MKVVHVPRRFVVEEWGGTETVILESCKELIRRGVETSIHCPNALADSNRQTVSGVDIHRYPYFYPYLGLKAKARLQLDKKGGNLFSFALWRALKKMPGLDLIHIHTAKRLGGICRRAALDRGIPYLVTLHGGAFDVPDEEAATWTEPTKGTLEWGKLLGAWVGSRRVFDDAAAIICLGEKEEQELESRYPGKRIVRLPNGVDPERFTGGVGANFRAKFGLADEDRIILNVGRIDFQKNQLLAVEAFGPVLEKHPSARLVLIGPVTNADYHARLLAAAEDPALKGRVLVIPGLDPTGNDLIDAYDAAEVFILPSVHEPFGVVILEAWAAGLPVAASRVGGVPSFVEQDRDGLLFESGDASGLAGAVDRLMSEKNLSDGLAQAGRLKVETKYSWSAVTDLLINLYQEVTDAHPVRQ